MALLFEPEAEQDKYRNMLNGGSADWKYDDPVVLDFICAIVVRRYFKEVIHLEKIHEFAVDLNCRVKSTEPPDKEEVEALVLLALGDRDPLTTVRKMPLGDIFFTQAVISVRTAFELNLSQREVVDIVVQAEKRAFGQDWKPSLLPS